jgi:aspartate kinase
MEYKVAKFGGSSLATADRIKHVCDVVLSDPARKYVVVSAPGKKEDKEHKVTDHLINIARSGSHIHAYTARHSLDFLNQRYNEIAEGIGINPVFLERIMEDLESRRASKYDSPAAKEDAIKAWGEDSNARIIAEHLKLRGVYATYVNPRVAGFAVEGNFGNASVSQSTYPNLEKSLALPEAVIIFPGFFGYTKQGHVATFSRGGSDLTGAVIAAAMNAREYENWTDVDGIYSADPRIVAEPSLIRYVTYSELRELSYMGFSVFHDEAISPVRRNMIPTHIRNTSKPEEQGSKIVTKRIPSLNEVVLGVACKKDFCSFDIRKDNMNKEIGFLARATNVFNNYHISIEHMTTGVDFVSVVISQNQLDNGKLDEIYRALHTELRINDAIDALDFTMDRAMVIAVGEGMKRHLDAEARITGALSKAKIKPGMISKPEHGLSIIYGVGNDEAEDAVRAIHSEMIK